METIIDRVIFSGMMDGNPPRLLFRKALKQAGSQKRYFTEAVSVPDETLQVRIATELQVNDQIELSVAYDYSAPGWPSHVLDFYKTGSEDVAADSISQELAAA